MRIRQLDRSPPKAPPDNRHDKQSKIYQITTITPIFGGGVEAGVPDEAMSIRATAIRGQLRHWWRFLVSHKEDKAIKDHKKLIEMERALWGGLGKKNESYASKIRIKVSYVTKPAIEYCFEYIENGKNENGKPKYIESFLHNIPLYVLFSGKGKKPCDRHRPPEPGEEPAKVILNGLKFNLEVSSPNDILTDAVWNSVLEAVRWWGNFGGIGARTRRGLGSIAIDGIKPLNDKDVEEFGCKLGTLGETNDSCQAWSKSISKLQSFRQGEKIGRRSAKDANKPKKLGRSYWPEADSIRLITEKNANDRHLPINKSKTFPRAAFGLPIIFDFNVPTHANEPPKTELSPASEDYERMASPLILKAQYIEKNLFLPIALLLPTEHLKKLELTLKCVENSHRNLPKALSRQGNEVWWPIDRSNQKKLASDIEPLKNRGGDALSAFMHYFSKNNN